MDEMHAEGAFNTDLFYILEEEGADDISSARIVDELITEGLIRKDPGGYNLTPKGCDTRDLIKYLDEKAEISEGELDSARKASFDWRHRWWIHEIIGATIGSLLTYYLS